MMQFDEHIFQMGSNHQLVIKLPQKDAQKMIDPTSRLLDAETWWSKRFTYIFHLSSN